MSHKQSQLKTITQHCSSQPPKVPPIPPKDRQRKICTVNPPHLHATIDHHWCRSQHEQEQLSSKEKVAASKFERVGKLAQKRNIEDDTTEISSAQHMSLCLSEYQLESTAMSHRKMVQFAEKRQPSSMGHQGNGSRPSSILKNSSRLLNNSLASSDRSMSIQDSFTALRRSKLDLLDSEKSGNTVVGQRYRAIVGALEGSSKGYTDDLFPPVEASIFNNIARPKLLKRQEDIVWKRASEVLGPRKLRVLPTVEGKAYSIELGEMSLASPYFASCLNALRNKVELLELMFGEEAQVSRHGIYLVKIFQQNAWKSVLVDDWVPCLRLKVGKQSKKDKICSAFVSVCSHERETYLWPLLLEKAYASYYRCYENLRVGNLMDMLAEVTGSPPSAIDFNQEGLSIEKGIEKLCGDLRDEKCIVLGENDKGLYPMELTVGEDYLTEQKVITFTDERRHIYRFDSDQLPTMFRKVYCYRANQYSQLISCRVYPPKKIKTPTKLSSQLLQIPPNDTVSMRGFTVSKRTPCLLTVVQKDIRFYYQSGIDSYLWVRAILMEREYDGGMRWVNGIYSNLKHIVFQEILQPGQYRLILMIEWRQQHNREICIQLASDINITPFKRYPYDSGDRTIELACMDLAQRKGTFSQINKFICSYNLLHQPTGLIIENIVNENSKSPATIIRSTSGLRAQTPIIPVNRQFEVEIGNEYGEKGQRAYGSEIELDLKEGESFTVVLRMRAGVDQKFFKMFHFS